MNNKYFPLSEKRAIYNYRIARLLNLVFLIIWFGLLVAPTMFVVSLLIDVARTEKLFLVYELTIMLISLFCIRKYPHKMLLIILSIAFSPFIFLILGDLAYVGINGLNIHILLSYVAIILMAIPTSVGFTKTYKNRNEIVNIKEKIKNNPNDIYSIQLSYSYMFRELKRCCYLMSFVLMILILISLLDAFLVSLVFTITRLYEFFIWVKIFFCIMLFYSGRILRFLEVEFKANKYALKNMQNNQ